MVELKETELDEVAGGASPYIHYNIVPGDTLSRISTRFHTDVYTLMRLNNIKDADVIKAGRNILIPRN